MGSWGRGLDWPTVRDTGVLPRVEKPPTLPLKSNSLSLLAVATLPFSEAVLAWALHSDLEYQAIRNYVTGFEIATVRSRINRLVCHIYPLFYAAERNCPRSIRLLLEIGADPNIQSDGSIPILAYLILHSERNVLDVTEVVKTLLAFGAKPTQLPSELWKEYLSTPSEDREDDTEFAYRVATNFFTPDVYRQLARGLHLSIRYFLWRASTIDAPGTRTKQVALAHKMTGLLEVPYHLIGQTHATHTILRRVVAHMALQRECPLVMVFAGPSGHGKTELAKLMGHLLSIESVIIDCTKIAHETDLFGSSTGYSNQAKGSPLNNFLASQNGKPCVVFLDEFEKSAEPARNALLLPWDSGTLRDKRDDSELDCSKTIWICATNLVDEALDKFFTRFLEHKSPVQQAEAPFSSLDREIQRTIAQELGAPLTGRMHLFVPFFPFDLGEQAVIAHKYILELAATVRTGIKVKEKKFIKHVHVSVLNDGQVCQYIAEHGYYRRTGARSLKQFVGNHVVGPLIDF